MISTGIYEVCQVLCCRYPKLLYSQQPDIRARLLGYRFCTACVRQSCKSQPSKRGGAQRVKLFSSALEVVALSLKSNHLHVQVCERKGICV